MDNYSIHKGQQVKDLIEATGAKVIYLPPYSPEFNPIENYWSKLKSILLTRVENATMQDFLNGKVPVTPLLDDQKNTSA